MKRSVFSFFNGSHPIHLLALLLMLIAFPSLATKETKLVIYHIVATDGKTALNTSVQNNIENHLLGLNRDDQLMSRVFKHKIESTVTTALQALGYYDAHFTVTGSGLPEFPRHPNPTNMNTSNTKDSSISNSAENKTDKTKKNSDQTKKETKLPFGLTPEKKEAILSKISWKIEVDTGEPVHIADVDIKVTGEAQNDNTFNEGIQKQRPKKGDQLDQSKYEGLKSTMQSLALERGYFNFNFKKTQLEIQPSKHISNYRIEAESGKRYKMGKVTFINSQINNDRMRSLVDFKEGDPYLLTNLGQLNQTLTETSWFKSISVDADLNAAKNETIPVNVTLVPDDRNHVELGVGYSTDLGPRFRATWDKPWVNNRGHSFHLDTMISRPEQELNAKYRMPLENVRYNYVDLDVNIARANKFVSNGIVSNKYSSSVTRYWLNKDWGWYTSFWGRWLKEDYTISDQPGAANLYLLGAGISRTRTKGGVNVSWGDKQSLTIEHSDKLWGSDFSLTQIIGQSSFIRQSGNHRGILKLKGGTTFVNDVNQLPPSLRFFTGGDNTIRGFGYQMISPIDSKGNNTGGTYMAVSSLEYQYRVWNDIWLATFLDSGDAWDKKNFQLHNGLGVGVRWASPIGPIRLDIAAGFVERKYQDYRIHLTLGPEL